MVAVLGELAGQHRVEYGAVALVSRQRRVLSAVAWVETTAVSTSASPGVTARPAKFGGGVTARGDGEVAVYQDVADGEVVPLRAVLVRSVEKRRQPMLAPPETVTWPSNVNGTSAWKTQFPDSA